MKQILIIGFAMSLLFSCVENSNTEALKIDEDSIAEVVKFSVYGDSSIVADGAIEPQEFLSQMEGKDSLATKVRATIVEACKKKGCWMTLDMENGDELLVRFKDYGFFVPTEGVDGKRVIIEGVAFTDTVSVAELQHLAEDANKSPEEIAAITEPEIGINFEATGVIIED